MRPYTSCNPDKCGLIYLDHTYSIHGKIFNGNQGLDDAFDELSFDELTWHRQDV